MAAIEVKNPYRYEDDRGNTIECDVPVGDLVSVFIRGRNNRLTIKGGARKKILKIMFDCNDAVCTIKDNAFCGKIRLGQGCKVVIGKGVTCTGPCFVSAAEEAAVVIGDDCMIASRNEIRADDAHPIFSVETGQRTNMPRSIHIGAHVWLAAGAVVLGGARIGPGSVIGLGSIVKGHVPNNCVAAGIPARVVRRDCAWERPHLSLKRPYLKPDASSVRKSRYWAMTRDEELPGPDKETLAKITRSDPEEAIRLVESYIEASRVHEEKVPVYIDWYYARALVACGRSEEAIPHLRRVTVRRPSHEAAKALLERLTGGM